MAEKETPQAEILETMVQRAIDEMVSQQFYSIFRKLGDLSKDMSPTDSTRAKLMLLEMIKKSSEGYFDKMRERILKPSR